LEKADAAYAEVLRMAPRNYQALHLKGAVAFQRHQHAEAALLLARALAVQPRAAPTLMCLGLAQAALGRTTEAETNLRAAVKYETKNTEAWSNLAGFLVSQNRLADGIDCYQCGLRANPDSPDALTELGVALDHSGKTAEAISFHNRALVLAPRHATAHNNLACSYQRAQRINEAVAEFDVHLKIHPDDFRAQSGRLFLRNYAEGVSREQLFAEHRAFGQAVAAGLPAPASMGRVSEDSAPSRCIAGALTRHSDDCAVGIPRPHKIHSQLGAASDYGCCGLEISSARRLRVGFLSPDLRTHSVAVFLEPLLRHLDPAGFEIVLYHDHFCIDATSERLKSHAALWRNFFGQPDDRVELAIRADAPDVLIDLAGHTGFNRLPLFARRLAPVQIAYLGYPNTTGLDAIDYRFTDAVADPEGEADRFHTEKLIRFAPTAWAYQPPATAPNIGPPPCTLGRPFTFGSFNAFNKVTDTTLRLWALVLTTVPGSRLILKSSGLDPAQVGPRLTAAGLDPARVVVLPPCVSSDAHLAAYADIDIALDPFPYNGTTTTCEALWMGRPVITLAGDRHAARVGTSLLTALGQPAWIARDDEDYIRIAAALAVDPVALARIAARLRDELRASPLLDHAGQAARFGAAVRACWSARCGRVESAAA
jgi:predicted O-linked N-acetylglucosamine transferase (SPINDLY family)